MKLSIDTGKTYGLVLEGGGAKGSYQIGAWKALAEAGVRFSAVAGASVGSLNGAMVCMGDIEEAEKIWRNITYSKVMDIDDDVAHSIMKGDFTNLEFDRIGKKMLSVIKSGGFDITPLKNLMNQIIDEDKIRQSGIEFFATTFSVDNVKEEVIDMQSLPEGEMTNMLMASAYFMVFKNEKIGGRRYMDGGSFDNVPIDVLIDKGYKDIILIRIYGPGMDTEKFIKIPDDVQVMKIAPRMNLGGVLEFDKKRARFNMVLGYYDAMRELYSLEGLRYYIDAPEDELYYLKKLCDEIELLNFYVHEEFKEAQIEEGMRFYTEKLFPKLARTLKLKGNWNYKQLYIAILENAAIRLKIKRFRIYTTKQLITAVHKAYIAAHGSMESIHEEEEI